MNTHFISFLLLTSLQVTAQVMVESYSWPYLETATSMGEAELCQYNASKSSAFNITIEKDNGGEVVCSAHISEAGPKLKDLTAEAQCRIVKSTNTYSVRFVNLEAKHSGRYICRVQTLFPPPVTVSIVNRTLLYVHDYDVKPPDGYMLSFVVTWIMIGVSVFLFVCLMVVLFIYSKRKHCRECDARKKEQNSEYMHMASVTLTKSPMQYEIIGIQHTAKSNLVDAFTP